MTGMVVPTIFTAVDRFSKVTDNMSRNAQAFGSKVERQFRKIGDRAFSIARQSAIVGTAVLAPMLLMGKQAADFEDKLADVSKTTGLQDAQLQKYGQTILDYSSKTRTSIDDLLTIGEIGGQLGIAQKDLVEFTKAGDKFNVALGKDFSGGVEQAITSVSKMRTLFADTKNLGVADSINRIGSVINDLGAKGAATSENMSDFILRMGALPNALKPSLANTAALGAILEELGVDSRVGAGGLTHFLLVAGKDIAGFSKQMGVSQEAAKKMLAEDPAEFVKKFSSSLQGLKPDALSNKLGKLGLNDQETIKVIGAFATSTEKLADGTDLFTKRLGESSSAMELAMSLQNEFNTKNNTAAAQYAKAKNQLQNMAITIGSQLLPVFNNMLAFVQPIIGSIINWTKRNPGLTKTIAGIAATVAGLSFAISIGSGVIGVFSKIISVGGKVILGFGKVIELAQTAQTAWNYAMAFSPIGAMIVAVGALALVGWGLYKAFGGVSDKQALMNEVGDEAVNILSGQQAEVMVLFEKLRNLDKTSQSYKETLAEIERIQPGITEQYGLQRGAIDDLNRAESDLIKTMRKRAIEAALLKVNQAKIENAVRANMMDFEGTWYGKLGSDINKAITGKGFNEMKDAEVKKAFSESDQLTKMIVQSQSEKEAIDPTSSQNENFKEEVRKQVKEIEVKLNINTDGLPSWMSMGLFQSSTSVVPTTSSTTE